jgi:hypothetical protein
VAFAENGSFKELLAGRNMQSCGYFDDSGLYTCNIVCEQLAVTQHVILDMQYCSVHLRRGIRFTDMVSCEIEL